MNLLNLLNQYIMSYIMRRVLLNQISKSNSIDTKIFKDVDCQNVTLKTVDDVTIHAWYISPIKEKPVLEFLWLHGNKHNRETFSKTYGVEDIVSKYKIAFLMPDYRDFGDSEGVFDVKKVNYDVEACIEYMRSVLKIERINIIGYSLGVGITLEYLKNISDIYFDNEVEVINNNKFIKNENNLVSQEMEVNPKKENNLFCLEIEKDFKKIINKVILISGFTSVTAMLEKNFFWLILVKIFPDLDINQKNNFNYDNVKNLQNIYFNNIKIFHGSDDKLIPYSHGEELAKASKADIQILENATHNTIISREELWTDIINFVDS